MRSEYIYAGSREFKLINQLVAAYENNDVAQFTSHIYQYNRVKALDDKEAALLLVVKNELKNGHELPSVDDIPNSDVEQDNNTTSNKSAAVKYNYSDDDDDDEQPVKSTTKHKQVKVMDVSEDYDDAHHNESKQQPPIKSGTKSHPATLYVLSTDSDTRNAQLKNALFAKSTNSKPGKSGNKSAGNADDRTLSDIEREIEIEMAKVAVDDNDTIQLDNDYDEQQTRVFEKQQRKQARRAARLAAAQQVEYTTTDIHNINHVDSVDAYDAVQAKAKRKAARKAEKLRLAELASQQQTIDNNSNDMIVDVSVEKVKKSKKSRKSVIDEYE